MPAAPTGNVPFPADEVAGFEVVHICPGLHDLADELVADDHRHGDGLLGTVVPIEEVQVGPADPGAIDADEYVIRPDLGLRNIFEPQSRFPPALDEGFHRVVIWPVMR